MTEATFFMAEAALALALFNTIMCFALLRMVQKPAKGPRGGWLRLDGSTLHGRIVFVDDIEWERELMRWGLDSNGCMSFNWSTDYTCFSGHMIAGPDDIADEFKTAETAPYRHKAKS